MRLGFLASRMGLLALQSHQLRKAPKRLKLLEIDSRARLMSFLAAGRRILG